MTTDNTYRIPAVNMPRLAAEVEKMNKRANKLGCQPIVLNIIKTVTEKRRDDALGFEYDYTFHECTITGEKPVLDGWVMVAALEPQKNSELLIREVPGETCPTEYRTSDLHCDQCGTIRRRNAVYVLRHVDEGFRQIGRNCLADFFGGTSPESLLNKAEFGWSFSKLCRDAEGEEWGGMGGPRIPRVVPINQFVTVVAVLIRRLGWVPRSKTREDFEQTGPEATANIAWRICTCGHDAGVREFAVKNGLLVEPGDTQLSGDAVQWAAQIDPANAPNTFMHDLGVCCRQQYVEWKMTGFVACVTNVYQRELERRKPKPKPTATSTHQGTKGERQVFENLTVVVVKPIPSDMYPKTLVKFNDASGNVYVWWASGEPDWPEVGKTVTVKATVKDHDEYNGTKQTIIERVKLDGASKEAEVASA